MARFGFGSRLVVLSVVLALFPQGSGFAATETVSMVDLAFNPKVATVTFGDKITWKNLDKEDHTVNSRSIAGFWNERMLREGQSWSFRFFGAGTFPYYCSLHWPMFGKVKVAPVVTPRSGPVGTTVTVTWASGTPFLDDGLSYVYTSRSATRMGLGRTGW